MSAKRRRTAHAALGLALSVAAAALGGATSCGSGDDPAGPVPAEAGNGTGNDADAAGPDSTPVRSPYGLDVRPPNATCKAPPRPPSGSPVKLEPVFTNVQLSKPVMLTQMPGDPSRMFVAQLGTVELGYADIVSFPVVNPPNLPTVVASVGPLTYVGSEGGLLGLAFHPKCTPASCRLYVSYLSRGDPNYARSSIGYLTSTDNGATFTGLTEIVAFEDTFGPTHRGGGIAFGPDGYLYFSFGDGSGGDDAFAVGQNKNSKASKILRIDVDNVPAGQTYGIPDGNPFKNGGGEPATWAYGFRNPFRFSFDRATGDLWVGDVGQNLWEEIDRVLPGGNYGWPCREGTHPYMEDDPAKCPSKLGLLDPVVEYVHPDAQPYRAVMGGVVYRGKAIPSFVGTYVYGDLVSAEVFTLTFDPTTGAPKQSVITDAPQLDWVDFAEDLDGEIYGIGITQGLAKLVSAATQTTPPFPDRLSRTGCTDPSDPRKPAAGLVPYGVNAPFWSDGASKDRFLAVPDGTTITVGTGTNGHLDLPNGSVLVKTFSLAGKRIETRLLVRHDDGRWAGYSYEWLDDESDAVLLPSSKRKKVGTQSWYFPARGECVLCHTEAAGRTLGLELGQLNGDLVYPSTNRIANQLETLDHIKLFDAPLGKAAALLPVIPSPTGAGPLDQRARAYLHTNCAQCHQPMGGGRGPMDLRFTTSPSAAGACNVAAATGDLGIAGAKLLVPGDPALSLLSVRPHTTGATRMPPLGASTVDQSGLAVVDTWIRGLKACP